MKFKGILGAARFGVPAMLCGSVVLASAGHAGDGTWSSYWTQATLHATTRVWDDAAQSSAGTVVWSRDCSRHFKQGQAMRPLESVVLGLDRNEPWYKNDILIRNATHACSGYRQYNHGWQRKDDYLVRLNGYEAVYYRDAVDFKGIGVNY